MQRPRRIVAADERDLETQFVQPVASFDVAEPPFTDQRTQRALDGRAQPRDHGLPTTEIGVAPGHLAIERRGDLALEVGGGEVHLLQDGVDHRAGQRSSRHVGQSERDRSQAVESGIGPQVGGGRRPHLLVRGEGLLGFASDRGQSVERAGDARIGHPAPSDVEVTVEAGRAEPRVAPAWWCHLTASGSTTPSTETWLPSASKATTISPSVCRPAPHAATSPEGPRSNRRRARGECWQSCTPIHHSTAWCCARVRAT